MAPPHATRQVLGDYEHKGVAAHNVYPENKQQE